ncbi:beta-galactosidase [Brachybacterium epidermidis]
MTRERSQSSFQVTASSSRDKAPRPRWILGMDSIAYGGDYNPDQWSREVWREDVALMREAGVNFVSLGIFSWAHLEISEGQFDFSWMDELFELLHEAGIRIDLATPTAAPPAWFFRTYPEARAVARDLTVLGPGSRGMASPHAPAYREACLRITRALAERYGNHPALALWHVHNEYGGVPESFSEYDQEAFRTWLQQRYGELEALNAAWGTAFWGQTFRHWEEVHAPLPTASVRNPALELDWKRFSNDSILDCYRAERDVLHEISPHVPVTTNFMSHTCPDMDLWTWADEVDIVSDDHYLRADDPRGFVELALNADLVRSLSRGRPWILMEHSTSGVNWQPRNVAKQPGEMARNSLSHLGRGADAIAFFQWRASRRGAEKFHSAMVPHAGTGSRVWREVCELGAQLSSFSAATGSRVRADVAILWDWESQWAQDLPWRPSVDLGHRVQTNTWYERLWRDHQAVDFVHPEADLSAYRLVLAPASYLLTDTAAGNLERYVKAGGNLVVGPFSGIVDENDAVREGGLNAALSELLGVQVHEFCPLRQEDSARITWDAGSSDVGTRELPVAVWCEELVTTTATVLARYAEGPRPGGPAITEHAHGSGKAWYVGSDLDLDGLATVFRGAYAAAGIGVPDLPADVEVLQRHGEDGTRYVVLLNHTDQAHTLTIPGTDHEATIEAGESQTLQVTG